MADGPKFEDLLRSALEDPGIISKAYSAFHSYSLGNQMAAYFQCANRGLPIGPIATFPTWKGLGRHVKKGEKALTLCMPITVKREREGPMPDTTETVAFTRFIWRANWFTVYQTEGEAYEPKAPALGWDKALALEALGITEEPFAMADGNCQGYAKAKTVAVSPIAVFPEKTLFHELAHVVLGHTTEAILSDDERTPRSEREAEAEGVAFILTATLGLPGLPESRGYVQHWLKCQPLPERSAQRIYSAANKILVAGQEPKPAKDGQPK